MASFLHSIPVSKDSLDEVGCITTLPVRIHRDARLADEAVLETLEGWEKALGHQAPSKDLGLSPVGHLAALTCPECSPDRLVDMANMWDTLLIVDDLYELANSQEKTGLAKNFAGFMSMFLPSGPQVDVNPAFMQLWAKVFGRWQELDEDSFKQAFKHSRAELDTMTTDPTDCMTMDEYIPIRIIHIGTNEDRQYQGLLVFGTGCSLSDKEIAAINHIMEPLEISVALTNDYFSYKKELNLHRLQRLSGHPFNAIAVLMKEHSIDEVAAAALTKEKVLELEREHDAQFKKDLDRGVLSETVITYITNMRLFAAGFSFWATSAPRYLENCEQGVPPNHTGDDELAVVAEPQVQETGDVSTSAPLSEFSIATISNEANGHHEPHIANGINCVVDTNGIKGDLKPGHEVSSKVNTPGVHIAKISRQVTIAPYQYLCSLPSKRVRDVFIKSLQTWLDVAVPDLECILELVSKLHSTSLMIDDVEDESPLRRGSPSAHAIFGKAQTINSANYIFIRTLREINMLSNENCLDIVLDEAENLVLGQGMELQWRYCKQRPTMDEYMTMIDNSSWSETGSLFRLIMRLMVAQSRIQDDIPELRSFAEVFGRYFQIRDDVKNLDSSQYASQKGYCEDLDEGKFSFPLVHSMSKVDQKDAHTNMILGILYNPPSAGLSTELKELIVNHLRNESHSFEFAYKTLRDMENELIRLLDVLALKMGAENHLMRLLIKGLSR
ncbi:hypothetical protein FQN57_001517 [Myotisia sp. PD_48]|nr:hypothetical protein FQN57_001517 [Myotisia sp. PD_48]